MSLSSVSARLGDFGCFILNACEQSFVLTLGENKGGKDE